MKKTNLVLTGALPDGVVFTGVPVYDSPCLLTERAAVAG